MSLSPKKNEQKMEAVLQKYLPIEKNYNDDKK